MKSSILSTLLTAASVAATGLHVQQRQSTWTVGQTVQTSSGPVEGHPANNDSSVSEYLGIRYAEAPIGNLRFAPPVAFNGTTWINGTTFVSPPLAFADQSLTSQC
jgi:hypothetical protein